MRASHPFDGQSLVDRAAERRTTVDLDSADSIVVSAGAVLLDGGRLAIVPGKDRRSARPAVFLGSLQGRDVVAVRAEDGLDEGEGRRLVPLREVLSILSGDADHATELELAVMAVAMVEWHDRHSVCGRCGSATESRAGGWLRVCVEQGHEHYPRMDPAVIVAITDEKDRLLLAHVGEHSPGRYSHLAGYVEPGESLEQAAHREVMEEASLRLDELEYVDSQPWPFPASIMVGFRARAASGDLKVDGVEVTDAFWVTRPDLRERLANGSIRLASPGTLSRRLIHEWYGGDPVDDAGVADA